MVEHNGGVRDPATPIPATVLGGYLGAGKTTLLNRLLADPRGRRIGVLVNDLGAVSVDTALVQEATDDLVTLANGCICCTLSDGFAAALDPLRALPLDAVVVECSGVADPRSVAAHVQTPGFTLDGIVVVVDAATIAARVRDRYVGTTVVRQLEAADLIVLNKVDLVADIAGARDVLARAAPGTPVLAVTQAAVATDVVLGLRRVPAPLAPAPDAPVDHPTDTHTWDAPVTRAELDAWLDARPHDVVRAKGVVDLVEAPDHRTVVQVVGRRRDITAGAPWRPGEVRRSAVVVIHAPGGSA